MSSNANGNGGIGFIGLLTIVFITLKLTEYIDWHWAMVLLPLWILPVIAFMVFLGAFFGALIFGRTN